MKDWKRGKANKSRTDVRLLPNLKIRIKTGGPVTKDDYSSQLLEN